MQYQGVMGVLHYISNWIMRLAYVNLLWLIFSCAGLIVFGLFPATTAMFSVIRSWIIHDIDTPVFKTFWKSYKREFIQSNIIGYFMLIIAYLLYINFLYIQTMAGNPMINLLFVIFFTLCLTFGVILLYVFPILVHYQLKAIDTIKSAFLVGLLSPFYTILMVSGMVAAYLFISLVPGMIPFFSGSLIALFIMANAYRAIIKIDHKTEHSEVS